MTQFFQGEVTEARETVLKTRRWTLLQSVRTGPKPVWMVKELLAIGKELGEVPSDKPKRPTYA